jgi:SAM-dependent methyltransferase
VRFSHKIKKLADPRTFQSAKRHLGRLLLTRRVVFGLDPKRLIESIDEEKFEAIRRRHAIDHPGDAWPKYLDLEKWMDVNFRRVRELELDYGTRKRILDIGCGAGYLLYICQWLGHEVLGLDIDEVDMYGEMTRMLGLKRVLWRVEAFEKLPDFGPKFDVITAYMICFNAHKTPQPWGPKEWKFFLDDLETRLNPGGVIRLGLNKEYDGTCYTPELRAYFVERGGAVYGNDVTFRPAPRASA